ncbi:MAG: MMPL family transporter [Trebonia sp.]
MLTQATRPGATFATDASMRQAASQVATAVLLALTALTAAIGVVTIVSHYLPIASSTFEVVVVVGMAVGVDYSLFYLRREREERVSGWSPRGGDQGCRSHVGAHDPGLRPDRHGHHDPAD